MNLKEVLGHFLDFRREIIINRTKFELKEAEERAHILEGLKIALENIDDVIAFIKKSKDPKEAKEVLIKNYQFSEKQAKAILDMRLQKLTSLEVDKFVAEYNDIQELIKQLHKILDDYKVTYYVSENTIDYIAFLQIIYDNLHYYTKSMVLRLNLKMDDFFYFYSSN